MSFSEVRVTPWDGSQSPSEKQLQSLLAAENLYPYRWTNGPGDVYSAHTHSFHKVIYVVRGSITFGLPQQGKRVELFAGDRLELPQGIAHDAVVGSAGVACLEAHR